MSEILLDRGGDAPLPNGYQLVTSEVEFLHLAGQNQNLMIRGEKLCAWAEAFYRGRGVDYRESISAQKEIIMVCPELTDEEAQSLVEQLGEKLPRIEAAINNPDAPASTIPSCNLENPPIDPACSLVVVMDI